MVRNKRARSLYNWPLFLSLTAFECTVDISIKFSLHWVLWQAGHDGDALTVSEKAAISPTHAKKNQFACSLCPTRTYENKVISATFNFIFT